MALSHQIVAKPLTDLTLNELRAKAATLGLGDNMTTEMPCDIFDDVYSRTTMRHIGQLFYSPLFSERRGGAWRIKPFTDATPSDHKVLLEVICNVMKASPSRLQDWHRKKFTKDVGTYMTIGVCRPLSDYDGDELFTMVSLPLEVDGDFMSPVDEAFTHMMEGIR